ncbi:MAG TPA: hypothetical protein VL295_04735 [Gemmatimonadales bacterium]|nr:hypothetical protein [Gemmatimonadales bacterium]
MMATALAYPEVSPVTEPVPPPATAPAPVDRCLYLLGRPTLKQVIRFVRINAVDRPSTVTVIEAWQRARRLITRLETEEKGRADGPVITKLGPEYEPLLVELLQDPLIKHGFNTLPTQIALVPLDQLVVYQRHIDLTHVEGIVARLGTDPAPEAVFRTCLPTEHHLPPVEWSQVGENKFIFVSPSNDLRSLGPMPLDPENIRHYPPPGALVGVAGIGVGFGSNFLNTVYAEGRLVLTNGSHRAYALRSLGVTHAPCIVQHVADRDELELVASSQVRKDPDLYLKAPRPSMLPDYFHPELQLTLPVHRRARQVTVRIEVEEEYVPML